jgi:Fe-S-cluster formation regulator IscX/YfhJ
MHSAYEKVCAALDLSPMTDRINEILVMKIVELAKIEGDPERLGEKVLAYYHSR